MALRADPRLRARMTEQADILATGNKSPRQHSWLRVPCGWCPRASPLEQCLHPSSLIREEMVGGHVGALAATRHQPFLPTHPAVLCLSSLPVPRIPSATTCP